MTHLQKSTAAPSQSGKPDIQPGHQGGESDFEKRLHRALLLHGPEAASRVHVIDFGRLRPRFGERWERSLEKIDAIATETIQRHLAPEDVFSRFGETSYLLVLARLNPHDAQLKCLLVAREIARRLVGSEGAAEEIDIEGIAIGPKGELEFRKADDPQFPALAGQGELAPESHSTVEAGCVAPGPALGDVQFVFRPLLALRGLVVSTYVCLPIRRTRGIAFDSGYEVLPDPNDFHQVADLDLRTAGRVALEAEGLAHSGAQALLSLPVHFETLANHQGRLPYLKFCARHLAGHAGRLIFELVNLPEGVPQSRLIELTGMLRPTARAVIARFPLARKSFAACRAAGLHAVGADIFHAEEDEAVLIRKMDQFVEAASHEGLKTYVHGIRTVSLGTAAITSGFDYVDGYALTSIAYAPRQAERFDLHTLYRTPLDMEGGP